MLKSYSIEAYRRASGMSYNDVKTMIDNGTLKTIERESGLKRIVVEEFPEFAEIRTLIEKVQESQEMLMKHLGIKKG